MCMSCLSNISSEDNIYVYSMFIIKIALTNKNNICKHKLFSERNLPEYADKRKQVIFENNPIGKLFYKLNKISRFLQKVIIY